MKKFPLFAAVACVLTSVASFAEFNACPFPGDVKLQTNDGAQWYYAGKSVTGFQFKQVLYPYHNKPSNTVGALETVNLLSSKNPMTHSQVACWYDGMLGHGALWLQGTKTATPIGNGWKKDAAGNMTCNSSNPNDCAFQSE